MIVVLLGRYIAILALFIWLKFIPFNTFWKISPLIVLLLLNIGLFIPMGWGAPQGPAVVVRNSVQIVPVGRGRSDRGAGRGNTPLKAGDVLFRIDPDHLSGDGQCARSAAQAGGAAPFGNNAIAGARRRPSERGRAAAGRSRPVEGAARRRAVESRQDHGARAGRRLRDQSRRCARARASRAVAGDGVHRHVRHDLRRRDPADQRALRRGRAAGRGDVQDSFRARSSPAASRQCCRRSRADRRRPAARRSRRRTFERAVHRPLQARRLRSSANACRPAAPAPRRSSPITSRSRTSSAP